MKKKLAIIGGGVSGLTAGIYAQMSGMESTVYEQHSIAGGELTGWERQGCHIDNCVHWLVGLRRERYTQHLARDGRSDGRARLGNPERGFLPRCRR